MFRSHVLDDFAAARIPLWLLDRPWLRAECRCGRSLVVPLHRLAVHRADQPLGELVTRLRCRNCKGAPARVSLVDRGDAGTAGGPAVTHRVWLIG